MNFQKTKADQAKQPKATGFGFQHWNFFFFFFQKQTPTERWRFVTLFCCRINKEMNKDVFYTSYSCYSKTHYIFECCKCLIPPVFNTWIGFRWFPKEIDETDSCRAGRDGMKSSCVLRQHVLTRNYSNTGARSLALSFKLKCSTYLLHVKGSPVKYLQSSKE